MYEFFNSGTRYSDIFSRKTIINYVFFILEIILKRKIYLWSVKIKTSNCSTSVGVKMELYCLVRKEIKVWPWFL